MNKELVKKIAELIKVSDADLSSALDTEGSTLELPELSVFTSEELAVRDKNIETQHYTRGREAGSEMLVKELKNKYGVEVEGKDANKFIDAYKDKVLKEANAEPSSKIEELNSVITGLRTTISTQETQISQLEGDIRISSLRSKAFTDTTKQFRVTNDKILHLMNVDGYSLDESDGIVTLKKNGEFVRDAKTQNILPANSIIESYAEQNGLISDEEKNGRGGENTKKQAITPVSYSQLVKDFELQGKSINGQEFMAKAQALAKDNPDFMKN